MNEEWKDIEGYEGLYQVSNRGNVRRFGCSVNRKLTKLPVKKGHYYYIPLCKNGKYKNFLVSRLVATAFIPNPNNKETVNHKDGNKTNNNVNNLEWNTYAENNKHAVENGLLNIVGENHYRAKLSNKKVRVIKHCLNLRMRGVDIVKYFSISRSIISNIKNNKRWKHVTI